MTIAVYLPLAMSALLAVLAHPLASRIGPRIGAWALAIVAAVVALCGTWSLLLLAASLADDAPIQAIRDRIAVNDDVSLVATALLLGSAARVAANAIRQRRLHRTLFPVRAWPGTDLVVVPDPRARAFALPGQPGRVVITDGMLRALSPPQRRALFAHERAHLAARHPVVLAAAQFAAAANPLLIPLRTTVGYLCERQADEVAATTVGDRRLVADALAAAAYAESAGDRHALPAFHHLGIVDRVTALVGPARTYHWLGLALALAAAVVAVGADVDATADLLSTIGSALPL